MQTVHMHRDLELERQRAEVAAAAAALGWTSDVGSEGMDAEQDGLMMVGADHAHAAMQGFSLMMMAAEHGQQGLQSFPMMMMTQEPTLESCTPSTVLSLQTNAAPNAIASEETNASSAIASEETKTVTKKRGRQKGPGKPKSHYIKERDSSFQLVLKLPLKSRKLFCVAEFYKYMSHSSSDSLCKVTEAYAKAGESVGVSGKTARKWVEDWERRADGTFSESLQGKHVKVEWLLQPEHLQRKAREWIEQNCPKKGDPPRKDSIIKMFRDFCNNELLVDVQCDGNGGGCGDVDPDSLMGMGMGMGMGMQRKISTETARSWLHRLGFTNFKDFRKSSAKSPS